MKTPQELAQHIVDLARAFNVEILDALLPGQEADAGALPAQSYSGILSRVLIAPVRNQRTYAIALHELGHCVAPLGAIPSSEYSEVYRLLGRPGTARDIKLLLMEERAAWEWARHHALMWTPAMELVRVRSLKSYELNAQRLLGHVPGLVRCACGAVNRLPTSGTARCGRCKGAL